MEQLRIMKVLAVSLAFLCSCIFMPILNGETNMENYNLIDMVLKSEKQQGAEFIELDNGYRVWTKRVGHGPIKILTLHGGPGSTHEYFECFEEFFPKDKYQLIFYDQLGSFYSDQPDDPSLWTVERFCEEIEQVRKHLGLDNFYLYGQSWGGLLAIEYSLKYPQYLKGVILSNITGSIESNVAYLNQLKSLLPQSIQDSLASYEDKSDFLNPGYEKIIFEEVYSRHLCRLEEWPDPLLRAFRHINTQVYHTMQGLNEFVVTGNLKDWNRWNDLEKITTPTLLICGKYDTMSVSDLKKMGQLIPRSRVKICENGSHCCIYDDQENYFKALHDFLGDVETSNFK